MPEKLGTFLCHLPRVIITSLLHRSRFCSNPSRTTMPLLSLPTEHLLNIIDESLNTQTSSTPIYHKGKTRRACTPSNATTLSHTCRLLRSLCLPFMYAAVTAHLESARTLHTLITSNVHLLTTSSSLRHTSVTPAERSCYRHSQALYKPAISPP